MIEKKTLESSSSRKRNFRPLISFFLMMAAMALIFFTTGISPFGRKSVLISDLSAQYAPLLVQFRNMLAGGKSLLYSPALGMGKNFLGVFAYYLSSPVNLISFLFPVSHISDAIVIIMMVKLSLAGAFMTLLLCGRSEKNSNAPVLFGMVYALSSFALIFLMNFMWLDGFAILPLLIHLLDKFRKDLHSWWKLLMTLIVLFASGYYMAYMVGVFSFFYLIFTLDYEDAFQPKKEPSGEKIVGLYCLAAICAAAVCACILLPAGMDTIRNKDNSASLQASLNPNFRIIQLIPQFFLVSLSNISDNLPYIYTDMATLCLVILFFRNPSISRRLKIWCTVSLGAGILSFLLPPLDMAWQLFDSPNWYHYRYSYLFSFGMILIAFHSFRHLQALRTKDFVVTAGVVLSMLLIAEIVGTKETGKVMFFQVLLVTAILMALLFGATKEKWPASVDGLRKYGKGLLCAVVAVELVFLNPKVTVGNLFGKAQQQQEFAAQVEDMRNLTATINKDASYRTEVTGKIGENLESLSFAPYGGVHGISTFLSMSNKQAHHFVKQLGYRASYNYFSLEHQSCILPMDALMGIRYILSENESIDGLTPIGKSGKYTLFENPYAVGPVFLAEQDALDFDGFSLEKEEKEKDYFAYQEALLTSLTGKDASDLYELVDSEWTLENGEKAPDKLKDPVPESNSRSDGLDLEKPDSQPDTLMTYIRTNTKAPMRFHADVTIGKEGALYLNIPFLAKACPHEVYANGKKIYQEDSDSYYSTVVDLGTYKKGDLVQIEIRTEEDAFASFTPILAQCSLSVLDEQMNMLRTGITSYSMKESVLSIDMESAGEQLLVTTIPYEEGWRAKVDGQTAEILPYQDAFLSLPVSAGTHRIELEFNPPGATIGVIISAVGVIASAVLAFCIRKKR